MGFDFTVIAPPPPISLWLLLCLWMWGIFFGEFQCLLVDDCPAASCDSGVLTRGSESASFYSAVLVPLSRNTVLMPGFEGLKRKEKPRKSPKSQSLGSCPGGWVLVLSQDTGTGLVEMNKQFEICETLAEYISV